MDGVGQAQPGSPQAFPWKLARGPGLVLPLHKNRPYSIAAALPKPCFCEDFYGPYAKASEKGPSFLTEYSTRQLSTQLTLLQQVGADTGSVPEPGTGLGEATSLRPRCPQHPLGVGPKRLLRSWIGAVPKVPPRSLPQLSGPGRCGQKYGRPQVSMPPRPGVHGVRFTWSPRPDNPGQITEPPGLQGAALAPAPCLGTACPSRASSAESLSAKACSLFLPSYIQDPYLLQLLRHADDVSTWVAAEVTTSHTAKVGACPARAEAWASSIQVQGHSLLPLTQGVGDPGWPSPLRSKCSQHEDR